MTIYLASNFLDRDRLREEVKPLFEAAGHEITSRWIWDDSHLHGRSAEASALHDLADVDRASALVLFTDQRGPRPGKGKFLELGYAIRAGKRIVLLGEDQDSSVFYFLPTIRHAKTVEEALRLL